MKSHIFNSIIYNRLKKIPEKIFSKNEEYSPNEDKLHNFRVAARVDKESMEKTSWGFLKKQLVCVMDMKDNPKTITEYLIDEKLGDLINHLILLEVIMRERLIKNLLKSRKKYPH